MKDRTYKQISIFIAVIVAFYMTGCARKATPIITLDDFDVEYKGMILNEQTSLQELGSTLNIPIDEKTDNIDRRWNTGDYHVYEVYYPDRINTELIIHYMYEKATKVGRIVILDLFQVPLKRGIVAGDHFEKLQSLYGDSIDSDVNSSNTWYADIRNSTDQGVFALFTFENTKITEISVYYHWDQAMEEMGLIGMTD